jgi:KUP system potassium uptake protein
MDKHITNRGLLGLCLTAVGVVFGDIGTSPLYTIKESLGTHYNLQVDPVTVFGVMSLVFWSMVIVVMVKYLGFILLADNEGEGGMMSLLALALSAGSVQKLIAAHQVREKERVEAGRPAEAERRAADKRLAERRSAEVQALLDAGEKEKADHLRAKYQKLSQEASRRAQRRAALSRKDVPRTVALISGLAIAGTALLLSDGVITPAITVLSAVEGLDVALPGMESLVLPVSILILVALFLVQRHGTDRIGTVFGPMMLVWFASIAVLGVGGILQSPEILGAVNPLHILHFFQHYGWHGVLVLGSVVLCITGGEALYADMGHFGRLPIRLSWTLLVMPCLLLNYFGQCASVLAEPAGVANPFYALSPGWFTWPLLFISTSAAIIASQSLITGSYSLAQQAMQLGYMPRLQVHHTSHSMRGQIYVPVVNYLLMAACLAAVIIFRSSTNLAAAYGIAVMGTMTITTCLFFAVALARWNWPLWRALALCGAFLAIDFIFTAGNIIKIAHGGWFPLAMGAVLFAVMTTWKSGNLALRRRVQASLMPMEQFLAEMAESSTPIARVGEVAVFLTQNSGTVPRIMLHHLKHTKVLHKTVIVMSVMVERHPTIPFDEKATVRELGMGFYQVDVRHGYMEGVSVPAILKNLPGLHINLNHVSYYLGHITLIDSGRTYLTKWRRMLYIFLSRNARSARTFFGIPTGRVVELGMQDEI